MVLNCGCVEQTLNRNWTVKRPAAWRRLLFLQHVIMSSLKLMKMMMMELVFLLWSSSYLFSSKDERGAAETDVWFHLLSDLTSFGPIGRPGPCRLHGNQFTFSVDVFVPLPHLLLVFGHRNSERRRQTAFPQGKSSARMVTGSQVSHDQQTDQNYYYSETTWLLTAVDWN